MSFPGAGFPADNADGLGLGLLALAWLALATAGAGAVLGATAKAGGEDPCLSPHFRPFALQLVEYEKNCESGVFLFDLYSQCFFLYRLAHSCRRSINFKHAENSTLKHALIL